MDKCLRLDISSGVVPLKLDSDGVIRVCSTRIPLETVITCFHEGDTADEITYQYPSLSIADIYSLLLYYSRRKEEIDAYLQERRNLAAKVKKENEIRFPPAGIRKRLMERR